MTPAQVKTLLESGVLQAYAEGKEIQFRSSGETSWTPWGKDSFYTQFETQWRVKPEKKTGWINIYQGTGAAFMSEIIETTKQQAESWAIDRANDLYAKYRAKRIACIQITYEEGEGL